MVPEFLGNASCFLNFSTETMRPSGYWRYSRFGFLELAGRFG